MAAPKNLATGQAGVYQVASQLLLRGYNPMFPAVDHGQDLVIDEGIRIQVKSGNLRRTASNVYPDGAYWFHLGKTSIKQKKQVWIHNIDWVSFCDFVIFWGVTENRFWIVPPQLLNGHQCLVLGPKISGHQDLDIETINRLMAEGKTQEEVAKILGVQQMTVSRRLRGLYLDAKRTLGRDVRRCEDRWDLIADYLKSIHDADLAVTLRRVDSSLVGKIGE